MQPNVPRRIRAAAPFLQARTLAHEILHRFGGKHDTKGILGDNAAGAFLDERNVYDTAEGKPRFLMSLEDIKIARNAAKDVT